LEKKILKKNKIIRDENHFMSWEFHSNKGFGMIGKIVIVGEDEINEEETFVKYSNIDVVQFNLSSRRSAVGEC